MNPVALVLLCGAQTITEVPIHSVPALATAAAQEADPQAVTVQLKRSQLDSLDRLRAALGLRSRGEVLERLLDELLAEDASS